MVEDDVYMREELIDVLKKAGYNAVPLLNFENAISQILALSPDLILLDINQFFTHIYIIFNHNYLRQYEHLLS